MELKKVHSVYLDKDKKPASINGQVERQAEAASNISLQTNPNKLRLPAMLQSALRQQMQESGHRRSRRQEDGPNKSKLGGMMRSGLMSTINKIKDISNCLICDGEIRLGKKKTKDVYMCECDHKYSFCESCLHHYVIYKVNNFEEVNCPQEDCPVMLDPNTPFFKNLPADIQKKYKKIRQFQEAAKDPKAKLCPQQNCEGIIRATVQDRMLCEQCGKEFCGKCLLSVHLGECDKQEILFFENNLHYRQCKKCGFVIEKNQGCNHMTCRCKNQFCYVCGAQWTPAHYGNHDQNGQLMEVPEPGANPRNENRCLRCQCCDDDGDCDFECQCNCCEGDCCECDGDCCDCDLDGCCCGSVIKIIIKVLLLTLFIPMVLLLFLTRDLFFYLCMFFISLFAGMCGLSFEILSDQEGVMCILGALFFPVLMVMGIGRAFSDFFCEPAGQMWSDYWEIVSEGVTSICDI